VGQTLLHWQTDHGLAGVRDDKSLTGLPAAERQSWLQFWQDARRLGK
jgi:hypothetical protein